METDMMSVEWLEALTCPAFIVKDKKIVTTNIAAEQRLINVNTCIIDLICTGKEEYLRFRKGKLSLRLCVCDNLYDATVTATDDYQVVTLEPEYETPELQALAKAAQSLREPLSNAIAGLEQIIINDKENQQHSTSTSEINRSLHQMLRAIGNMSDAGLLNNEHAANMLHQDVVWIFDEILQKASDLAQKAGRVLTFSIPNCSVMCNVDAEKLERAVLNLISNALKFSSPKSRITATLKLNKSTLSFSVENRCDKLSPHIWTNFFSRFQQEPLVEDGRNGIGLGLSIVRKIALMHNGTFLLENPNSKTVRITMTLSIDDTTQPALRSAIKLPVDRSGGYNLALRELSDALPGTLFTDSV